MPSVSLPCPDRAAPRFPALLPCRSGRFLRPAFPGYRAVVTRASDGAQSWVRLDHEGAPTFLQDYMSGGTHGGIFAAKRSSPELTHPSQYGYNQCFEQVFQAFEQRLSPRGRQQWAEHGWVDKAHTRYDCPADRQLAVSFQLTPQVRAWDMGQLGAEGLLTEGPGGALQALSLAQA
jgi:hypothetical protein